MDIQVTQVPMYTNTHYFCIFLIFQFLFNFYMKKKLKKKKKKKTNKQKKIKQSNA